MWSDVVVVLFELCGAAESGIVGCEGLEESFDLALRGGFSNGTEDMFDAMLLAEFGEAAFAVVAVEL
jgi:hypothetical protein